MLCSCGGRKQVLGAFNTFYTLPIAPHDDPIFSLEINEVYLSLTM